MSNLGIFLMAIAQLCTPDGKGGITPESRRMVSLLIDGVRYNAEVRHKREQGCFGSESRRTRKAACR